MTDVERAMCAGLAPKAKATRSNRVGCATSEQNWALRPERPAAHDEAFQNGPPADDADFVVIDLDLVNHGPDLGSPEWRLARQDIRSHHPDEFSDLLLSDPRLVARFSEGAVECDLRDVPLVFYSGDAFGQSHRSISTIRRGHFETKNASRIPSSSRPRDGEWQSRRHGT